MDNLFKHSRKISVNVGVMSEFKKEGPSVQKNRKPFQPNTYLVCVATTSPLRVSRMVPSAVFAVTVTVFVNGPATPAL